MQHKMRNIILNQQKQQKSKSKEKAIQINKRENAALSE
jgi:hypothetical protein